MRKFIGVVFMLVLAVCIVACGNKEIKTEVNPAGNTENVVQKPIQMYFPKEDLEKFAASQTIRLPEDSTSGYEWIYVVDDAEVFDVIKDEFVLNEGLDIIDGGKGERVCEIKGLKEGETILYFDYVNGNDESGAAEESVKFYIEVNANNEIAVTDEIH